MSFVQVKDDIWLSFEKSLYVAVTQHNEKYFLRIPPIFSEDFVYTFDFPTLEAAKEAQMRIIESCRIVGESPFKDLNYREAKYLKTVLQEYRSNKL